MVRAPGTSRRGFPSLRGICPVPPGSVVCFIVWVGDTKRSQEHLVGGHSRCRIEVELDLIAQSQAFLGPGSSAQKKQHPPDEPCHESPPRPKGGGRTGQFL